jgi:hypothetical protein
MAGLVTELLDMAGFSTSMFDKVVKGCVRPGIKFV